MRQIKIKAIITLATLCMSTSAFALNYSVSVGSSEVDAMRNCTDGGQIAGVGIAIPRPATGSVLSGYVVVCDRNFGTLIPVYGSTSDAAIAACYQPTDANNTAAAILPAGVNANYPQLFIVQLDPVDGGFAWSCVSN